MAFNNAVNAKQQGTQYLSTVGAWTGIDGSAAGDVLTSNGTGVAPSFQTASAGPYFSLTPFIVGADVHSQFTTIGAAITAAVGAGASAATPANIYVKPGTYVESPNIVDGIHVRGMISDSRVVGNPSTLNPELTTAPNVLIQGTVTYAPSATTNDTYGSLTDVFVQPTAGNANAIVFNSSTGGVGEDYFTMTNCVGVGNGTGHGYAGLQPGAAANSQIYAYNCNFSSYANGENGVTAITGCWIGAAFTSTNSLDTTVTYCNMGSVSTSNTGGPVLFNNCIIRGTTNVSVGTAVIFESTTLTSAVTGGSASLTFSDMRSFGTLGGAATVNSINQVIGDVFVGGRSGVTQNIPVFSTYFGHTGSTAVTLSLPSTAITNQIFVITDEGGSATTGNITINVVGGAKTINGAASVAIILNFGVIRVIYDGTNYFTW
jgi:hypothetical protein